jgi:hypothetical protein
MFQKDAWAAQVHRESTLAVGLGDQGFSARNSAHMDRKENLQRLAGAFPELQPKDYMQRVMSIIGKEL